MGKLRVALEWFLNADHAPLLVGLEKGWFAAAGLELELVEPAEHFDAFEGMRSGAIDIAITEPIHLSQDVAKGESMVGFARFLHTRGGVLYLKGCGIERPADLVGKRVQYPGAPGPGGRAIVGTMIEADGGPVHSEAGQSIVPVNNGFFHTEALVSGKADAATLAFANFELVEAELLRLDAGLFLLQDFGVPDFCQLIFIALPEAVKARAEELRNFLRVLQRGIAFATANPAEAKRIFLQRSAPSEKDLNLSSLTFDATLACFRTEMRLEAVYFEALGEWLVRTGQTDKLPPVESYWTNALVPEAELLDGEAPAAAAE
ncbi:putative thiamine biosynthesis protein [Pavlovales sp. CCMP2436]|nr:putative thiamine biosynthesis protein [Pavlovales sp. CCMP2436]|mmetsp:Transcript_32588/g.81032  ORF Transcript_32588/g.81032 Transcript_32588/m.81032 type:complete len:318 (-) Transcript_32588:114-1067(-)